MFRYRSPTFHLSPSGLLSSSLLQHVRSWAQFSEHKTCVRNLFSVWEGDWNFAVMLYCVRYFECVRSRLGLLCHPRIFCGTRTAVSFAICLHGLEHVRSLRSVPWCRVVCSSRVMKLTTLLLLWYDCTASPFLHRRCPYSAVFGWIAGEHRLSFNCFVLCA